MAWAVVDLKGKRVFPSKGEGEGGGAGYKSKGEAKMNLSWYNEGGGKNKLSIKEVKGKGINRHGIW